MARRQLNVRVADTTRQQLKALTAHLGMTEEQVLRIALDRMFRCDGPKTPEEQERIDYRLWIGGQANDYDPTLDQDGYYSFEAWKARKNIA